MATFQFENRRDFIQYPEVINNHFKYQDAVNVNNGDQYIPNSFG